MKGQKLSELAKTIRSKNAGVDKITFDIIFSDRAAYERVKRARVITRDTMARLYAIAPERISDFVEFDPASAIKFPSSVRRAAVRATLNFRIAAVRAVARYRVPGEYTPRMKPASPPALRINNCGAAQIDRM